jgi:hypothetical protein
MKRAPKRLVRPVVLACGFILVASLAFPAVASARPVPRLANPTATARPLVNRFLSLLQSKNIAGLKQFLTPGFQIECADGSGSGKTAYLADLPTINSFTVSNVTASESNGVLVARYQSAVVGVVNGKPYTPGSAPRLSVFSWNGTRWQLAAHANFNPLTG